MRRVEFKLSERHILQLDTLGLKTGSRVSALRFVLDSYFDKEAEMRDLIAGMNHLLRPLGGEFTYVDGALVLEVQRKRHERTIRPSLRGKL